MAAPAGTGGAPRAPDWASRRKALPVRASASYGVHQRIGRTMNLHLSLAPLLALLAGILILAVPKLLNFIVAIYLIAIGLVGLLGAGSLRLS
jgi:hypothetical protein